MTTGTKRQRWRAVGVEWRGYKIARVRDNSTGEVVPVYQRRPKGAWLRWDKADSPVGDPALAATASRALAEADPVKLEREWRERVRVEAERAEVKLAKRWGR